MEISSPSATQIVAVAPPGRVGWKEWLPVISLLIVIAGVLLTGGKTIAQVNDGTRRIEVLERRADQRDDQLRDVQVRIAGMDAKLDLLVDRTKEDRR